MQIHRKDSNILLALFIIASLADIISTQIGLKKDLVEGNVFLRFLPKEMIPVVQLIVYSMIAVFGFESQPVYLKIVLASIPFLGALNNVLRITGKL